MADEIPVACCLSDEGLIVHTAPIEDEHKPIVLGLLGAVGEGWVSRTSTRSSALNQERAMTLKGVKPFMDCDLVNFAQSSLPNGAATKDGRLLSAREHARIVGEINFALTSQQFHRL